MRAPRRAMRCSSAPLHASRCAALPSLYVTLLSNGLKTRVDLIMIASNPLLNINEGVLYQQLRKIFPEGHIHINVKKDINIKYPASGALMEFDLWLPQHNLCFEFQDSYHYASTWYKQVPQEHIRQQDYIKKELAHRHMMTLVEIPCWWDGALESLIGTISFQRPDIPLEVAGSAIISLNPPVNFFRRDLPGVGELMLASFPQNNNDNNNNNNNMDLLAPEDNIWWIGEKYDGIRYYWYSPSGTAYSRHGRTLALLTPMTSLLPTTTSTDGEIWFGRGQFSHAFMLLSASGVGSEIHFWPLFRMMTFDNPPLPLPGEYPYDHHHYHHHHRQHDVAIYESRYQCLLICVATDHPFNLIVPRMQNARTTTTTIMAARDTIIDDGGEGLILQQALSTYQSGRSSSLFKLKGVQRDQEGIVLAMFDNNAVSLKLANNTTVFVPPENVQVMPAPSIGDIVSFAYEPHDRYRHHHQHPHDRHRQPLHAHSETTMHPTIFRVRKDLTWDEVVDGFFIPKRDVHTTGESDDAIIEWIPKPGGLLKNTQSHTALYMRIEKRKQFFERYAQRHEFDPLAPQNWYVQPLSALMAEKGIHSVMSYHSNSISKALADLFPDIGLDRSKFKEHKYEWITVENRRAFFKRYAQSNGFDALVASNWYSQPLSKIVNTKGAQSVMFYHGCSIVDALSDLFPNIQLDKSQFERSKWDKMANRRRHFEKYASSCMFDPLVAEHWYHINLQNIMATKGTRNLIMYHENNVSQALVDLFPNIGLDRSKFCYRQKNWTSPTNRRQFFEAYAKARCFDPLVPKNWYSQSIVDIMACKGAKNVIGYHKHSISQALIDLFPEAPLVKSMFSFRQHSWDDAENRRLFFSRYAQAVGFDPLNPSNWYVQVKSKIMAAKGARSVLSYHSYSIPQALVDLFPTVGLNKAMFQYT